MEVGRLREPLLRSSPFPLLSFLVPSITPAWRPTSSFRLSYYAPSQDSKAFSTTTRHEAERSTATEPSGKQNAPRDKIAYVFERTQKDQPPSAVSARTQQIRDIKLQTKINAKLDQMFPSKGKQSLASSADDVRDAYYASTTTTRAGLGSGKIAGSMLMPHEDSFSSTQRQVTADVPADSTRMAQRSKRTIRSRPALGRTVEVEPALGADFGIAYKRLSILLSLNKVRQDLKKQKYYERAGAKRKRLKSERWRKFFQAGFRATVAKVKRMRRQGW